MRGREFSDHEIAALEEWAEKYGDMPTLRGLACLMDRSAKSLRNKAIRLGLIEPGPPQGPVDKQPAAAADWPAWATFEGMDIDDEEDERDKKRGRPPRRPVSFAIGGSSLADIG